MLMNYHELTINEPRNAPARRKQFIVITVAMFGMISHAAINAGVFAPLHITSTINSSNTNSNDNNTAHQFQGGTYIYKLMKKDYSASGGTLRTIMNDLGIGETAETQEDRNVDGGDLLFSVFMDDEWLVPGGDTRFAGGLLLTNGNGNDGKGSHGEEMKQRLLDANLTIGSTASTTAKEEGVLGKGHSTDVKYQVGVLPTVKAAVAQHPFTNGAFSAILQSYKIIPAFKKYATENGIDSGKNPIIIATCSANQQMCTFYMPLSKRDKFFLGNPTSEEYAKKFTKMGLKETMGINFDGWSFDNVGGVNLNRVFKGIRKALGMGPSSSSAAKSSEL